MTLHEILRFDDRRCILIRSAFAHVGWPSMDGDDDDDDDDYADDDNDDELILVLANHNSSL